MELRSGGPTGLRIDRVETVLVASAGMPEVLIEGKGEERMIPLLRRRGANA